MSKDHVSACVPLVQSDSNYNTITGNLLKIRGLGITAHNYEKQMAFILTAFHIHFQLQIYDDFYDSMSLKEKQSFTRCPEKKIKFSFYAMLFRTVMGWKTLPHSGPLSVVHSQQCGNAWELVRQAHSWVSL